MSETPVTYRAAPEIDAEPMVTLLATVRACVNRLAAAHLAYGAAECGPEYPPQRGADFAVAWERLERDVARERQRVTALEIALVRVLAQMRVPAGTMQDQWKTNAIVTDIIERNITEERVKEVRANGI